MLNRKKLSKTKYSNKIYDIYYVFDIQYICLNVYIYEYIYEYIYIYIHPCIT